MQLELDEEAAAGFRRLGAQCLEHTQHTGEWVSPVTEKDGRYYVRARRHMLGAKLSRFRYEGGELSTGWENFSEILGDCRNLRGATLQVAICVSYTWMFGGKRGVALTVDQMEIQKAEPRALIDHFA